MNYKIKSLKHYRLFTFSIIVVSFLLIATSISSFLVWLNYYEKLSGLPVLIFGIHNLILALGIGASCGNNFGPNIISRVMSKWLTYLAFGFLVLSLPLSAALNNYEPVAFRLYYIHEYIFNNIKKHGLDVYFPIKIIFIGYLFYLAFSYISFGSKKLFIGGLFSVHLFLILQIFTSIAVIVGVCAQNFKGYIVDQILGPGYLLFFISGIYLFLAYSKKVLEEN